MSVTQSQTECNRVLLPSILPSLSISSISSSNKPKECLIFLYCVVLISLVLFQFSDICIRCRTTNDESDTDDTNKTDLILIDENSENGLRASFDSAWNVVSERRSEVDLKIGCNVDEKTKNSTQNKFKPSSGRTKSFTGPQNLNFTCEKKLRENDSNHSFVRWHYHSLNVLFIVLFIFCLK